MEFQTNSNVLKFFIHTQSFPDQTNTIQPKSASNTFSLNYNSNYFSDLFSSQIPYGYWDDLENQRKYFEWIASQRGFKTQEDWYQLKYDGTRIFFSLFFFLIQNRCDRTWRSRIAS